MKRILALALAVLLVLTLGACGQEGQEGEEGAPDSGLDDGDLLD